MTCVYNSSRILLKLNNVRRIVKFNYSVRKTGFRGEKNYKSPPFVF